MGDKIVELLGSIFTVAAGVAIIALLVSNKSATSNVIQSWFSGNANLLVAAELPVSGPQGGTAPNLSYPDTSTLSFGHGAPNF